MSSNKSAYTQKIVHFAKKKKKHQNADKKNDLTFDIQQNGQQSPVYTQPRCFMHEHLLQVTSKEREKKKKGGESKGK